MSSILKLLKNKKPKTTTEIIEELKSAERKISVEDLRKAYIAAQEMADKFKRTGQEEAAKILWANIHTFNKEQWLIEHGYTKYFQKSDLEALAEDHKDNIYITKLSRFERPLPEEAIKAKEETEEVFDEYFVLYTDYTGREERRVEAEARERDPILLGAFKTKIEDKTETREYICRRVYVVAEWEDAWCDLKMEKLLSEYEVQDHTIEVPTDLKALEAQIMDLLPNPGEEENEGQD